MSKKYYFTFKHPVTFQYIGLYQQYFRKVAADNIKYYNLLFLLTELS